MNILDFENELMLVWWLLTSDSWYEHHTDSETQLEVGAPFAMTRIIYEEQLKVQIFTYAMYCDDHR